MMLLVLRQVPSHELDWALPDGGAAIWQIQSLVKLVRAILPVLPKLSLAHFILASQSGSQ